MAGSTSQNSSEDSSGNLDANSSEGSMVKFKQTGESYDTTPNGYFISNNNNNYHYTNDNHYSQPSNYTNNSNSGSNSRISSNFIAHHPQNYPNHPNQANYHNNNTLPNDTSTMRDSKLSKYSKLECFYNDNSINTQKKNKIGIKSRNQHYLEQFEQFQDKTQDHSSVRNFKRTM